MSVSAKLYSAFFENLAKGKFADLSASGTGLKMCLTLNTLTINQDTLDSYNNIKAYEVANGNGYTTGGLTVTTKAISRTTRTTYLDFDNPQWTSMTKVARAAHLYYSDPASDSDKKLIAYVDFGLDISVSVGTLELTLDILGFLYLQVAA
jgi:hypothetical protein